jgi:hypothetical protein
MRITIVLVKIVLCRVEGFKMEQRAAINICAKLKKTATETFEMLKSAYNEEFLSRTSEFEWHKRFKSSSESENAKIAGEHKVDCIFFMLKVSFFTNCPGKTNSKQ